MELNYNEEIGISLSLLEVFYMFIEILWILYYRLQCMRVTINAAFYFFITFKPLSSLDNVARLGLWILLFILLTPIEFIIAIMIDTCDVLGIATDTGEKLKEMMRINGKTKDSAKKEYEAYAELIFDSER